MNYPPSKLPQVGTTIFTRMSQLAAEQGAINLSQGFPDFDGPALLKERVCHYLLNGHNQYAPMTGVPALRQAIASKIKSLYGYSANADTEITVTSGATEAIFAAIAALVGPGDEVIVFDPAYDCYEPAISLNGGITHHLPLLPPHFGIDWDRLKDALHSKTRMVIVNNPHNPTGAVFSRADLDTLAELLRGSDTLLLGDEVYEHIVFDGQPHLSLLCHPELAQRSVVVSSFGKTYHTTGWKVGYVVAPALLSAEVRKVHQYLTFSTSTPFQLGLADFLEAEPDHYLQLPSFYQAKRDEFCQLLAGSRFRLTPTRGTYFQLLDYSAISDRNDVEMAEWLTREVGVAAIPISVFYSQPPADLRWLRFCFAKGSETLQKAAERLCKI
ncbi:pyridoxal phosphate-dependent aminotransferase [Pokkaliibacter sp. MBI-7]|uniref:pyridoxal phosphate-dependent aminotransferase n=1 Tax=Pokkaliibacter sp. MBI-7 TaxID=3040600 RepID=UPI0024489C67|nr:pyridoxal phosphate-dependent aminotransferase [Pokkaliibacter sp. MBI-7]MDH2431898.1 pyridoxal phosphate-dependent aminotransferase [Pokkaliibacter sp. MBI-7]